MWRHLVIALATAGALAAAPAAVAAQDSSLAFNVGAFSLRGEDARVAGDVLNANRCIDVGFVCEPLLFDVNDFTGAMIGAEYLVGIGDYFEVGAGISFYQRTVPSIYEFLTNADGSEIEQDLKLRIVPLTGTVRFIPTGRASGFQPYIGVGLSLLPWRYSETGSFVDTTDFSVFRATYVADGTEIAPVILGGAKFPLGGQRFLLGGEIRYQDAEGELSEDFIGDRIDLGGFTYQAVFQVRF